MCVFFLQAEDGIRDLVRSRGLGDVYKRQHVRSFEKDPFTQGAFSTAVVSTPRPRPLVQARPSTCLLYTSDAADERSSVDLGGRRIIKKKKKKNDGRGVQTTLQKS